MAGQSRLDLLTAQILAAVPSVAHGTVLKYYSSARGRRDLHTEALFFSDESEDSYVGSNASSDVGIMVSDDEDSMAGSMVAQSIS